MMHNVAGKSLQRNSAHRAALRRNFTVSLLMHERVETTLPKAKALRPWVEKVISLGKKKDLHRIRQAVALLQDKAAVRKLFDEIGPRFANRPGGYTRILHMANRPGDNAEMALMALVEQAVQVEAKPAEGVKKPKARMKNAAEAASEASAKKPRAPRKKKTAAA